MESVAADLRRSDNNALLLPTSEYVSPLSISVRVNGTNVSQGVKRPV